MESVKIGVANVKSQVFAIDLKTGRALGKLGKRGASHVASDGEITAISYPDKRTHCYDASNGHYIRQVGKKGVSSLNLIESKLVIGYEKGGAEVVNCEGMKKRLNNPFARLQKLAALN